MLAEIVAGQRLDAWEQELLAYVYLTSSDQLLAGCAEELVERVTPALRQLKLLPQLWAEELCRQILDS